MGSRTREAGHAGRGAARAPAHHVRPRNDQGDGLLPRHRELFAALSRDGCRANAPPTLLDYLPARLHDVHRRDRTRPCRSCTACITATARARRCWWSTDSACRSALDNRPLTFEEFEHRVNQLVYVSATPGPYELTKSAGVVVEQIIRPTGLIDPHGRSPSGQRADGRSAARDPRARGEATSACS